MKKNFHYCLISVLMVLLLTTVFAAATLSAGAATATPAPVSGAVATNVLDTSIAMAVGKPYCVVGMRITRVDTSDGTVVPYQNSGVTYVPVSTVIDNFRGYWWTSGSTVKVNLGGKDQTLAGAFSDRDGRWWAPVSAFADLAEIVKAEVQAYNGYTVVLISNEDIQVANGWGPNAVMAPLAFENYYCVEELMDRISADSSDALDYVSFMLPRESYELLYISSNNFSSPSGDSPVDTTGGTGANKNYVSSSLYEKQENPTGTSSQVEITDGEYYTYYKSQTVGLYIPNKAYQNEPMNLLVYLDSNRVSDAYINTVDNLVAEGIIPPTVILAIQYGSGSGAGMPLFGMTGSGRSNQYDTNDNRFGNYLIEKVLPQCGLGWNGCGYEYTYELSEFASDHAIWGGSSGGPAAYAAAWYRDDFFGNAVAFSATILNVRLAGLFQSGIRTSEHKNVRFFNQVGTGDWDWAPGTHYVNGYLMAETWQYKGYDFYFSTAYAGHGATGNQVIPSILTWLWADVDYGADYGSQYESKEYWANFADSMYYNVMTNKNEYTAVFSDTDIGDMTGLHFGNKITLPAAPKRSGYTFLGWNDGEKNYDAGAAYGISGNVSFTAEWTETGSTDQFTDLTADWYKDTVKFVVENGLMNGTGKTTFAPSAAMTRGMIMTILARMDGVDTSGSSPWYQAGMEWAVAEGVSDGTNPGNSITREQLVTMLWRYAGKPNASSSKLESYSDAGMSSDWAADGIAWAVENGIIAGSDGKVNPQGIATRAEAATMLMRFCQKVLDT